MKFFKKLKAYNKEEARGAMVGFGVIKAMNYDSGRKGHLILFSLIIGSLFLLKKIFVPL